MQIYIFYFRTQKNALQKASRHHLLTVLLLVQEASVLCFIQYFSEIDESLSGFYMALFGQ